MVSRCSGNSLRIGWWRSMVESGFHSTLIFYTTIEGSKSILSPGNRLPSENFAGSLCRDLCRIGHFSTNVSTTFATRCKTSPFATALSWIARRTQSRRRATALLPRRSLPVYHHWLVELGGALQYGSPSGLVGKRYPSAWVSPKSITTRL